MKYFITPPKSLPFALYATPYCRTVCLAADLLDTTIAHHHLVVVGQLKGLTHDNGQT